MRVRFRSRKSWPLGNPGRRSFLDPVQNMSLGRAMTPAAEEQTKTAANEKPLVRIGLALAGWSERWFPDALVFALLGILVVFVFGVALGESPAKLAIQG